jgi:hypothetical protein
MQYIVVASHRRSGTHLLIDSLINNLENCLPDYINLDTQGIPRSADYDCGQSCIVCKTHAHGNIHAFFEAKGANHLEIDSFLQKSKVIYIHRDGRDVLVSLYHYMKSFHKAVLKESFECFIKNLNDFDADTYNGFLNRIEYWMFHIDSWSNLSGLPVYFVSFDEIIRDFCGSMRNIESFLDMKMKLSLRDLRLTKNDRFKYFIHRICNKIVSFSSVKRSSINFRAGVSNAWKKEFSNEAEQIFASYADDFYSKYQTKNT